MDYRINELLSAEEARSVGLCVGTRDHRAGLEAVLTERKPPFSGQ